jgi:NitT/TauT family transport system substrate-binding protein
MRFRSSNHIPVAWWIIWAAIIWLLLISYLHLYLNGQNINRNIINMGYMPVITNLACPLLDYASRSGVGIRFNAIKFSSFAEMAEALRNDDIQVAFIIAPLSIVLQQQGVDVRVICIGNRHESTLVTAKSQKIHSITDLAGKTVAVPMRYSGHNLSMLQLMEKYGMEKKINIVEMNPPDMASALTTGSLSAYYVGEPFAAQTIKNGDSCVLFYVEEIWPDFICNLVLVRQAFIDKDPDVIQTMVTGAARSGIWANQHPKEAAKIASQYWNQPSELIEYALTHPENRIIYDHFVPRVAELQQLADLMQHFNLVVSNDITRLVEDRFAKNVNLNEVTNLDSIFRPPLFIGKKAK